MNRDNIDYEYSQLPEEELAGRTLPPAKESKTKAQRVAQWRAKNRGHYRDYMRKYMQSRRNASNKSL